jgi:hypothetical protein
MAKDPKYKDVQFISICCDQLDGARSIIEKDDDLRWQNVHHYFMSQQDKETAKAVLGFKQVPFYVVLDDEGNIQQSGNGKQVDFDDVPGVVRPVDTPPVSPIKNATKTDSDSFDDLGLSEEFCLDFTNKSSIVDDINDARSSPVQVIDESLFDNDDF